jgi:uncharacterized glyoxalase superfamily protein PhnB
MARAVRFYESIGFRLVKGGAGAAFTTLDAGSNALNLISASGDTRWAWWGRVIFYVADVDAAYRAIAAAGVRPDFAPRDAEWGERYFHLTDPDGHELSFAAPLAEHSST